MELTTEELQFLNSVLSQINPQGLDANMTRVGLWAKVQQELEARQEDEDESGE